MSNTSTGIKSPSDADFEKCLEFLNEIGVKVLIKSIGGNSFLPGLSIENG